MLTPLQGLRAHAHWRFQRLNWWLRAVRTVPSYSGSVFPAVLGLTGGATYGDREVKLNSPLCPGLCRCDWLSPPPCCCSRSLALPMRTRRPGAPPSGNGTACWAPPGCPVRPAFGERCGLRIRRPPGVGDTTRQADRKPISGALPNRVHVTSFGPADRRSSRVAQLVEQVTVNHRVGGSSPSSGAFTRITLHL